MTMQNSNNQRTLNLWRAGRFGLLAMLLLVPVGTAQRSSQKTPLELAKILVRELRPEDTSYQHQHGTVKWKGEQGAQNYACHTDCSGFLNLLLERAYGYTPDDFAKWLKSRRPLAGDYHDAIQEQRGFKQIQRIEDVRPGDIIAIRYPPDAENSGHIMLIAAPPRAAAALSAGNGWDTAVGSLCHRFQPFWTRQDRHAPP